MAAKTKSTESTNTKKSDSGKKTLVIVESPSKAKTINKYLGSHYFVTASMGHIIDLPKSRLAVDVDNNFKPEYITVRGKGDILNGLKKLAAKSDKILLASDNDREGEAIAYHIGEAIHKKYPDLPMERIVFNEITKNAILDAIKNPRQLETGKIDAQKTRRILDRLVGYKISPILWAKVKGGLSAGRVQSVALKAICDRENEVEAFIPEEYWTLEAQFSKDRKSFTAELSKIGGNKPEFKNKQQVDDFINSLDKDNFIVSDISSTMKSVKPIAPFTTSKMQQAAANRFGFTSKKTMSIAQQLYEGIDIGKDRVGFITYMRTDSTRVSDQAIAEVREYIGSHYADALPEKPNSFSKSENAQDAHEAIRPTSVMRTPDEVKKYLTPEQFKLYSMIWERFVSSQMTPAEHETITAIISNGDAQFRISKSTVKKQGYNAVLDVLKSKETDKSVMPHLEKDEKLKFKEFIPAQHFTQPPPRYTDATIIKFLEENNIGRPSTYAPTISTLLDRYYAVRKAKQIMPTVLGTLVNKIICQSFPEIVNIDFTSDMENRLDKIENGQDSYNALLHEFWPPFIDKVNTVMETLEDHKITLDEQTDQVCEKCGRPMLKKLGKYGFFYACSGFPECRNAQAIPLGDCPREGCTGKIVPKKKSGRGKEFYGCTHYPECDFISWDKPTEFKCPKCGKYLIEKTDKIHGTYKLCVDPKCGYKQLEEH